MTLLATIHLGDFAIIASDKKEVAKFDGAIISQHEEAEKIISTDLGLITGSGYVDLLDAVKERITSDEIEHTDQMLNIIKYERDRIKNLNNYGDFNIDELLNYTGWLFSYFTVKDNFPCLRICLYHPSIDENHLCIIEENTCKAIFPFGVTEPDAAEYSNYLKTNMRTLNEMPDINQNLSHNIRLILFLMDEVSKNSDTVSKACDIGVVFKNSDTCMARNISIETPSFTLEPI